jgi:hypothetical protein
MSYVILDISTAPLPEAADYLEEPAAPANYKDPDKIAAYVAAAKAGALAKAALDPDLCRITCIGWCGPSGELRHVTLGNEGAEHGALMGMANKLARANAVAVTFSGSHFDLHVLQRRAAYLGVPFPRLDLSRYKSQHIDVCDVLAGNDPQRRHSLDFFVKRLGWADLDPKPMPGEEEAKVFEHQKWAELAASVRRDTEALRRLAIWAGCLPAEED